MKIYLAVAAVLLSVVTNSVGATPIKWRLNNVNFNDGGNASGTFVFDAATSTYSDIAITTTAGTLSPGATYSLALVLANETRLDLISQIPVVPNDTYRFLLSEFAPLTDAGGILSVPTANSVEAICVLAGCGGGGGVDVQRRVLAGATIESVPEPATLALLTLGAAGFAYRRRRNLRAAQWRP